MEVATSELSVEVGIPLRPASLTLLILQILKLFAWEPSFEKRVSDIRARELKNLVNFGYLQSVSVFVFTCAPSLVSDNSPGEDCTFL